VNVTDAAKDSVMYLAAETKYSKSDCAGAVKEFSNYLKAFPDGAFAVPAHFYKGECLAGKMILLPRLLTMNMSCNSPKPLHRKIVVAGCTDQLR
jgi:hypothetical protein